MKKQIIVGVALAALSLPVNAQFEIDNNAQLGTTVEVLSESQRRFTAHFNTNAALWESVQVKGLFARIYTPAGETVAISKEHGKSENLNGSGDPLHLSDVAGVQAKYGTSEPVVGLFNVNGEAGDQAFGAYAGTYKKVELALTFALRGCNLQSDISFDVSTLDAGNTGRTATYKLLVGIDYRNNLGANDAASLEKATSADNTENWFVIENFYTTGSKGDRKSFKLAELIKGAYTQFNSKTIYLFLYTEGTDSDVAEGNYEPIIGLDNLTFTYDAPLWIEPAIQEKDQNVGYNDSVTIKAEKGKITPLTFRIKDQKRGGTLVVRCNSAKNPAKSNKFYFPERGAVKANDGAGNYTMEVPYTYTPCETNGSMVLLTIAAPESGQVVEDDLEITFSVDLTASTVRVGRSYKDKMEIDNGIRYFQDVFIEAVEETVGIEKAQADRPVVYVMDGCIRVKNSAGSVEVYSLSGSLIKTVSAEMATQGIPVVPGIYLVSVQGITQKVMVE